MDLRACLPIFPSSLQSKKGAPRGTPNSEVIDSRDHFTRSGSGSGLIAPADHGRESEQPDAEHPEHKDRPERSLRHAVKLKESPAIQRKLAAKLATLGCRWVMGRLLARSTTAHHEQINIEFTDDTHHIYDKLTRGLYLHIATHFVSIWKPTLCTTPYPATARADVLPHHCHHSLYPGDL